MAKKAKPKPGLTLKQRLFVEAYLGEANGNASEAARLAGYAEHKVTGSRLLTNANIRALVQKRVSQAAMSADEVLARVTAIGRADLGDFLRVDKKGGWTVDLQKAKGKTSLLRKLKRTLYGPDIQIQDPFRALKLLGEHHGLWRLREASNTGATEDVQTLRDHLAKPAKRR